MNNFTVTILTQNAIPKDETKIVLNTNIIENIKKTTATSDIYVEFTQEDLSKPNYNNTDNIDINLNSKDKKINIIKRDKSFINSSINNLNLEFNDIYDKYDDENENYLDDYIKRTESTESTESTHSTITNSILGHFHTAYGIYSKNFYRNISIKLFFNSSKIQEMIDINGDISTGKINLNSFESTTFTALAKNVVSKTIQLFTKGAVYIRLKNKNFDLLFVNLHLPILTDDTNKIGNEFGLQYRTKCLLYVLNQLKDQNVYTDNTIIFVGGDLNFRITSLINDIDTDQLKQIFDKMPTALTNFEDQLFTKINEDNTNKRTCKFESFKKYKKKLEEQSLKEQDLKEQDLKEQDLKEQDLKSYIKCRNGNPKTDKTCFNNKRIPSFCDRILTRNPINNSSNYIIAESTQEIIPLLLSSDHNAVINQFTLNPKKRGGKKQRSKKRRSNKNKRRRTKRILK